MYYWVNQGKTYKEEYQGGYLWAPFKNKKGNSVFHWDSVDDLVPNDIVFNYFKGEIVGYCIVQSKTYNSQRPEEFSEEDEWEESGRIVDADYKPFYTKIKLSNVFEDIKELLPEKYSPISKNSNVNQGYLYSIPEELGIKLMNIANVNYENIHKAEESINEYSNDTPNITSRKGLVTSRVGQGEYRRKILKRWKNKCAVTDCTLIEVLIASHILPWRDSTNQERLDVDNGILLSPTYDALFDRHFISFEDNGNIILSNELSEAEYLKIGVTGREKIDKLTEGNLKYLRIHRDEFHKKNSGPINNTISNLQDPASSRC